MSTSRPNTPPSHHSRRLWVCLVGLALAATGCSKVDLYSDLPEREANIMMAALLDEGVDCTKEAGDEENTWKLMVTSDDFSRSVNVLDDMGYPMDKRDRMGEVFRKSGLVSSPTEDRIRYVYALSEELAETITRIDGVVDARVHVALPDNDPFADKVLPASASVYIKHRSDVELSASRAQVQELVAKSIEGLTPENVEVFMDELRPTALPRNQESEFSRIMGIQIAPGSVSRFWTLVAVLIAAVAVNLVLVVGFAFRHHLADLARLAPFGSRRSKSSAANP